MGKSKPQRSSAIQGPDSRKIFHMINSCETIDALIECMNPQDDIYFGWNFTNFRKDAIGTVEFRRPPGVAGRVASLSWMNFTAAFAGPAATVQDPTDLLPAKKEDKEKRNTIMKKLIMAMRANQ
jgi:hypothetical protein